MTGRVALDPERLRAALASVGDAALADARIEAVPNWGGFVNRSFEVRAGAARFFLKLTSDADVRAGLGRWHDRRERLETLYGAPRALAWVHVEGTPFAGLLLEWVEGTTPKMLTPGLVGRVGPLLDRLHADGTLREGLAEVFDASRSCAERYRESFHDRFVEDLKGIASDPPPFVDRERLHWMETEAARLHRMVSASRAFEGPADAPVHGDPWLDNLIAGGDRGIRVVDWDELALGDPVHDWAVFLGPGRRDLRTAVERMHLVSRPLTDAERERLRLLARATSLDWVIDPLADWVDADPESAHGRAVRRANEPLHEEAFARYSARHVA